MLDRAKLVELVTGNQWEVLLDLLAARKAEALFDCQRQAGLPAALRAAGRVDLCDALTSLPEWLRTTQAASDLEDADRQQAEQQLKADRAPERDGF